MGKATPSPAVLQRLHGVLYQRAPQEEWVMPAEVQELGWRKGKRSGVVLRGARAPRADGTVRVGGNLPWCAEGGISLPHGVRWSGPSCRGSRRHAKMRGLLKQQVAGVAKPLYEGAQSLEAGREGSETGGTVVQTFTREMGSEGDCRTQTLSAQSSLLTENDQGVCVDRPHQAYCDGGVTRTTLAQQYLAASSFRVLASK